MINLVVLLQSHAYPVRQTNQNQKKADSLIYFQLLLLPKLLTTIKIYINLQRAQLNYN